MRKPIALAFGIVLAQLVPHASARAAVIIDSFSTTQSTTSGVPTSNVADGFGILGGERDVDSFLFLSANGTVPGQLRVAHQHSEPPGRAGVSIIYDGNDNSAAAGSFGGLGTVDLTQGGINDRFRLDITSVSSPTGVLTVRVRHIDQGSSLAVSLPGGPGLVDLPFALFEHDLNFAAPADFSAVGFLQFDLEFERRDSVTIDSIMAVPEPNTLLLALAGGGALIGGLRLRRVRKNGVRPGDGD